MTIRRLKTYAGSQGYVYQYYFVGSRPSLATSGPASTEYVFDVTSDRKVTFSVSVLLYDHALQAWAATHGRQLTSAEQYAAAKLRLMRGFDETEDMRTRGRVLPLDTPLLEEFLADLQVQ